MRYDVVIIGSGLGGLVCGCLLAKAGRQVLVIERQARPGGCLQSYQRHGLSFDTGFHYVGGLAEGQRLHCVFSDLGLMRLPWQRLDVDAFDCVTIAGETFNFAQGYDHFVEVLAARFPHQRDALNRYVETLRQIDAVPLDSDALFRDYGVSAYDYLSSVFSDPLLVQVLAGASMKQELRQSSLPLFSFAHSQSSFIQSSWRLRGDGGMVADVLVNCIRQHGGEVRCRCEADELVERDGRIVAVGCTDGACYEGDTFISDIHPAQTLSLVKQSACLKRLFRNRINGLENTSGMFTASLALKPGRLRYFNHNKFIYRYPDVWRTPVQTQPGELPRIDRVMVSARVPETDDSVAQLDLLTPMPVALVQPWVDTRVGHRGERYERLKRHVADDCIRLAETVLPGLSGMVSECYTSTPLTWRDYTMTPDGSAYGIRKDCRNLVLSMLSPRTPVPNLLLTGQSLMLPGLEGVTMTALMTCAELLGSSLIEQYTIK
ncbi:MAG: NAD(P)/FAD-dependent oxidoreductase [Prevotella sp.]|nr:NAD(P)/FAD-dependent oxidoreductase [Prevotella sp.]